MPATTTALARRSQACRSAAETSQPPDPLSGERTTTVLGRTCRNSPSWETRTTLSTNPLDGVRYRGVVPRSEPCANSPARSSRVSFFDLRMSPPWVHYRDAEGLRLSEIKPRLCVPLCRCRNLHDVHDVAHLDVVDVDHRALLGIEQGHHVRASCCSFAIHEDQQDLILDFETNDAPRGLVLERYA